VSNNDATIVTQKAATKEAQVTQESVVTERLIQRAYEIWQVRKKAIPIGLAMIFVPMGLLSLIGKYAGENEVMPFGLFVILCWMIVTLFLVTQISSKKQQYSLLVDELAKHGYSRRSLKEELRKRLRDEKADLKQ
jgi:uncharacterized membrane protein